MPPPIDQIAEKYMIQDSDAEGPYHPGTTTHSDCKITPLIGLDYFSEFLADVERLTGTGDRTNQGIYIANWKVQDDFLFPFYGGALERFKFSELLEAKKMVGIDVRLLAWVNDYVLVPETDISDLACWIFDPNIYESVQKANLRTVSEFRRGILANSTMINTLDHPYGSSHMKFVLVFNGDQAVGYTGGLDFAKGRQSEYFPWHDVQIKVEGKPVQEFYDLYKSIWNELLKRVDRNLEPNPLFYHPETGEIIPGVPDGALPIDAEREFAAQPDGKHWVQSLRTIPRMDSPWWITRIESPISFATEGVYEIQLALFKAIQNAETYIYVEDQCFWSRDLYQEVRKRIRDNQDLKLILLTGKLDPDDRDDPHINSKFMLRENLTQGLSDEELVRIVYVKRKNAIVHSKVWIIDDKWALIGSANMTNRSLYTDIEHSVSFIDEEDQVVKQFRISLWGEHLNIPFEDRELRLDNIEDALKIWNPSDWGEPQSGTTIPEDQLTTFTMPLPVLYGESLDIGFKTLKDIGEHP